MSDWIYLDSASLNPERVMTDDNGVKVHVSLSPHDVPIAVRGYKNPAGGFTIEFRYIDEEVTRDELHPDNLRLRVGKYSNRLYSIEIPPSSLSSDPNVALLMTVEKIRDVSIDEKNPFRENVRGNRAAVAEAVTRSSSRLAIRGI